MFDAVSPLSSLNHVVADPSADAPASRPKQPRVVVTDAPKLRRAELRDIVSEPHPLVAIWWRAFFLLSFKSIANVLGFQPEIVVPWILMAAGTWTFTNGGRTKLLDGTFDIDTDSWKMALFTSASNLGAATTTYAGVTSEVANANGYTTGGIAVTLTLSGTTTVTVDVSVDPVWTASGGSITARFAAIYEVSGNVLCFCLLDSTPADVTATDGNTLTVQINASGVFTLA